MTNGLHYRTENAVILEVELVDSRCVQKKLATTKAHRFAFFLFAKKTHVSLRCVDATLHHIDATLQVGFCPFCKRAIWL
jgi:hypothetical protein